MNKIFGCGDLVSFGPSTDFGTVGAILDDGKILVDWDSGLLDWALVDHLVLLAPYANRIDGIDLDFS